MSSSSINNMQIDTKVDWNDLFNINQFAFSVWDHFHPFEVLPFSSVVSSWHQRIWQFEDDSNFARYVNSQLEGKNKNVSKCGKRKKFKQAKQETNKRIKDIHGKSSNNVTSANNLYLHSVKTVRIHKTIPINSRLRAFLCTCINLKHLTISSINRKHLNGIGFERMKIIVDNCPRGLVSLKFEDCKIERKEAALLQNLTQLKQLSIVEYAASFLFGIIDEIPNTIPNLSLNLFEDAIDRDIMLRYSNELLNLDAISYRTDVFWISFNRYRLTFSNLLGLGITMASLNSMFWDATDQKNVDNDIVNQMCPNLIYLDLYAVDSEMNQDAVERICTFQKLQSLSIDCRLTFIRNSIYSPEQWNLKSLINLKSLSLKNVKYPYYTSTNIMFNPIFSQLEIFTFTCFNSIDNYHFNISAQIVNNLIITIIRNKNLKMLYLDCEIRYKLLQKVSNPEISIELYQNAQHWSEKLIK